MTSLLLRYPTMRGLLLDTPTVIERAKPRIQATGIADRCELFGSDFFADMPAGGDLYLLSYDRTRTSCDAPRRGRDTAHYIELALRAST